MSIKKILALSIGIMFLLSACIFRVRPATVAANPTVAATSNAIARTTEAPTVIATKSPAATPASVVRRAADATHKICQLTGDTDRELNQPALNQTGTKYGVLGTDLGFSFPFDNRLYFLFGDTVGVHGGDSIAYS